MTGHKLKIQQMISRTLLSVVAFSMASLSVAMEEHAHQGDEEIPMLERISTLTFTDLLDAAIKVAPEASRGAAFESYAQAWADKSTAWLADAPSIGLDYQTDALHDDQGYSETEASIRLPLWRRGEKAAAKDLAKQAESFARDYAQSLRLKVAGRLRTSLWALETARSNLAQAQSSLTIAQELDSKIRRLVELGARPATDQLLSKQVVLQRESEVLESEAALRAESLHYAHLTEMTQMPAVIEEPLADGRLPDNHPALAALRLQLAQANHDLQRARRSAGDQPSLSFNWRNEEFINQEGSQKTAGIGLTLPLGSKRHSGPAVADASKQVAVLKSDLRFRRHRLEAELDRGRMQLRALEKSFSVAQMQLETATQQHRLAKIAYENGELDIIGLLQSQSAWFKARRDLVTTEIRKGETIAKINQALGVTP